MNILVLDNNRHFISIMRMILRQFNVGQIHECIDAFLALETLKSAPVDLAFVDLNMPDLDGIEFTKLLRRGSDSPNKKLPIVLISADARRASVQRALQSGADDYLLKPIRAIDVHDRICRHTSRPHEYVRTDDGYYGPDWERVMLEAQSGHFC